jgi:iron uptake system EfeUOB component EfeO/EfeM
MKIRVLYPTAFASYAKKEPAAGSVIDLDTKVAEALIADGAAEKADAKASVERATKAPGEKRRVGRPRKGEG